MLINTVFGGFFLFEESGNGEGWEKMGVGEK